MYLIEYLVLLPKPGSKDSRWVSIEWCDGKAEGELSFFWKKFEGIEDPKMTLESLGYYWKFLNYIYFTFSFQDRPLSTPSQFFYHLISFFPKALAINLNGNSDDEDEVHF